MPRWLPFVTAAACLPPQPHARYEPAPVAKRVAASPKPAPTVRVALFDPSGVGTWDTSLVLTPAPATVIAPCLPAGGSGYCWVKLATNGNQASATTVAEASPGTSDATLACIARALTTTRLPPESTPMQMLVYVTFSEELPPWP